MENRLVTFYDDGSRSTLFFVSASRTRKYPSHQRPDLSKVEWDPDQKAGRWKMADAVAFAQRVLADPEQKAAYAKRDKRKGSHAYHLAISEYMRPPKHWKF